MKLHIPTSLVLIVSLLTPGIIAKPMMSSNMPPYRLTQDIVSKMGSKEGIMKANISPITTAMNPNMINKHAPALLPETSDMFLNNN